MIYAIRAVGTQFVKIGRASSVGKRLKELETGCPHELHIEAVADWPDAQESAVHFYLKAHCEKFEWFRDSEHTAQVIKWMQDGEAGLRAFRVTFLDHAWLGDWTRLSRTVNAEYQYPSLSVKPKKARRARPVEPWIPPSIPMFVTGEDRIRAREQYERIKQSALQRIRKAAARRTPADRRETTKAPDPAGSADPGLIASCS